MENAQNHENYISDTYPHSIYLLRARARAAANDVHDLAQASDARVRCGSDVDGDEVVVVMVNGQRAVGAANNNNELREAIEVHDR